MTASMVWMIGACGAAWVGSGLQPNATPASETPPTPTASTPARPAPAVPAAEGAAAPELGKPFRQTLEGTTVVFEMVPVPAGSVRVKDTRAAGGEREVSVAAMWVLPTEVTWDMYDVYVFALDLPEADRAAAYDAATRPSRPYIPPDRGFGHAGYPAISLHFRGAKGFCEWLSEKTGRKYRLPTADEFAYLCAAGGGDAAGPETAWTSENSENKTQPVGKKKPNAWGLFDTKGNVAEWCVGPDGKGVAMGGSYLDTAADVACESSQKFQPSWNQTDPNLPKSRWWMSDCSWVGFRIVCERVGAAGLGRMRYRGVMSSTSPSVTPRLSIMMFLQFAVWGAWYVTVANYMGRAEVGMSASVGHAYTVGPIAAIVSPFFLGMIADRFFSTEKVLGVLHLVGGAALLAAPSLAPAAGGGGAPTGEWLEPAHVPFLAALLVHMLCYMPTLGLTNSLAFAHVSDPARQFPVIRVFGTIGWIVSGIVVSKVLGADFGQEMFYLAGGLGVALGLYSFSLPHTPPPAAGKATSVGQVLGVDALKLMADRSFAVFVVCSFLLCIPLAAYYAKAAQFLGQAGDRTPAFTMSFGQMSEILFMLAMPWFFRRLGVKWMLLVGMLAWVARYGLFSAAADDRVLWMITLGVILHGVCYDFFFVTGFIYVERRAPVEIRSQAQGFLVLVTQGLGLGVGAQVIQAIERRHVSPQAAELSAQASALRTESAALLERARTLPDQAASLTSSADDAWSRASELLMQTVDWSTVWMIPMAMAGVIAVFIFLTFRGGGAERKETAP